MKQLCWALIGKPEEWSASHPPLPGDDNDVEPNIDDDLKSGTNPLGRQERLHRYETGTNPPVLLRQVFAFYFACLIGNSCYWTEILFCRTLSVIETW